MKAPEHLIVHLQQSQRRPRHLFTALPLFLLALVVLLYHRNHTVAAATTDTESIYRVNGDPSSSSHHNDNDDGTTTTTTTKPSRGSVVFTCPNSGKIGLHVVHARFLISQADAGLLFTASRLHLMETFMVPSLAGQSSLDYVFYASYDPKLSKNALQAFIDTVELIPVHAVLNPEGTTTEMALGFEELVKKLAPVDPRVKDAEIFAISRLDVDDAAHVESIAAVQEYACEGGGSDGNDSRQGKESEEEKEKEPTLRNVRLMYVVNGTLWWPSKDPFGTMRLPRPDFKIFKNLAVMQTMILSGKEFLHSCRMDVYSYPHYKPEALQGTKIEQGCPGGFEFNPKTDVFRWGPPVGEFGWLYSKTLSSWTATIFDHRKSSLATDFDVEAVQRSFNIDKATLATANLLFAGFAKEEPGLLQDNSELKIE